jgi:hypothetical protein
MDVYAWIKERLYGVRTYWIEGRVDTRPATLAVIGKILYRVGGTC